jgi:hypothetical protein
LPRVALVVVLGGLVGLSPPPHARAERRFDSPREETLYWRARRNPFRAHAAALEWAKRERHPGEGYVALAEIDLDLGHVDKARRVLTKIERDGESDAVRARGRELLARASEP